MAVLAGPDAVVSSRGIDRPANLPASIFWAVRDSRSARRRANSDFSSLSVRGGFWLLAYQSVHVWPEWDGMVARL
jgi:hypothetical protein